MKDETNLVDGETFEQVEKESNDYMDYYNNHRYQWGLKRNLQKHMVICLETKTKKRWKFFKRTPI
jgi:hypothetical protein